MLKEAAMVYFNILWNVDPMLGNDRESSYATAVTE
jgi:hypothetical protein